MAPPSPRRSSRARATNFLSHQSSTSSGRAERNHRANNKTSSGKSTPSASLSSEPLEDYEDTLLGRRRKRGHEDEPEKPQRQDQLDTAHASDNGQDEEDEAVRCICDSEDYPGRPPVDGPDADFFAAIELTEDVTGFFVQCDICKVWQHGACVGIFSAEASPDEYFCEQCRNDLHKINTAINGQKYSKYLPLHRPPPASQPTSRATSVSRDRGQSPKGSKEKNGRPTSSQLAAKRRSTMNSRDAAYDDDQLRRAIEASRENNSVDGDGPLRRTKRGRSDSEENVPSVKRQRTNSHSPSPPPEEREDASREQSEDEAQARNGAKKTRNGRHQRTKSEVEDKDRLRQEAANKRRGRAERRRGDDSDPSEDLPLAQVKAALPPEEEPTPEVEPTIPPPPVPGTPPATVNNAGNSHKKGARSNHKKGKGKGPPGKDLHHDREDSPARPAPRDIAKAADDPPAPKSTPADSKPSGKGKAGVAHKITMLDMKRRVGAIMDFISRTQVDLAAEGNLSSSSNSTSGEASPQKTPLGPVTGETNGGTPETTGHDKDFKDLDCMQMMDVLTRDMVKWQNQYK
ncbi:Histone deacetylase complex subunit-like protein [Emericellopsis cladophorae]|uniref:Histone deacetylase complex subunit-like protein n=1 Tax=Emericellopsis cladophorae TaxID=2686198 RepID=A0A9P9Y491_9HYPO|nr:Histone deacetylase complex subunit-like protein [Emericellopsis cladophorae]KAI6783055.1 Histone deacetylase complex subunit-like protein [Emericellopsis cladophorae]